MRRVITAVCAALALIAATVLGTGSAAAQPLNEWLPLHIVRTGDIGVLLIADAQVAGRTGRWLIDTGSSQNLVSPQLADALGLVPGESRSVATAAGVRQGAVVELPAVLAGGHSRERVAALRVDLAALAGPVAAGIDGVLGAAFFADTLLHIDLANPRWQVQGKTTGAPPAGEALEMLRGVPVVRLVLAGNPGRYVLDTGSAGGVVQLAGARAPLRVMLAPEAQLGGRSRAQVPVARLGGTALGRALPAGVSGLAGMALLDGCRFTLDFAAARFAVHGCDRPALPGGFGLQLAEDARGLFVASVFADSPAALAGLRVNDRVLQLAASEPPGSLPVSGSAALPASLLEAWVRMGGTASLRLGIGRGATESVVVLERAYFLAPLTD